MIERAQNMADDELIDAYHEALDNYEAAKATCGNRVDTFVQLVSAEVALVGRFGSDGYLQRFGHSRGSWPAIAAVPEVRIGAASPTPHDK